MNWRRRVAVFGLFSCGFIFIYLSIGTSWSIQIVATYTFLLGGLTEWVIAALASHFGKRARPVRPWVIRGAFTAVATIMIVVVSWNITDAIHRP